MDGFPRRLCVFRGSPRGVRRGIIFGLKVCFTGILRVIRINNELERSGQGRNRRTASRLRLEVRTILLLLAAFVFTGAGCNIVKTKDTTPTLLRTENASKGDLIKEIDRFANVSSLRAKMDLKFEDNSFAQFGSKEVYRSADGDVVVQRPSNIYIKVQVPAIKTDVAEMTSDGTHFRVAILQDGGSGKNKKFVLGSNEADYSSLQQDLENSDGDMSGEMRKNVSAFANLRPQHFTDALLVKPTDAEHLYTSSTIFQVEEDETQNKKSPLRKVVRGYYLLDEYMQLPNSETRITRRFWFDRVGNVRLARQQIFDEKGEVESDIVYGKEGNLTATGEYQRLPLQIIVTRPQEKYSMRLTYQSPETVTIGKKYPQSVFLLENSRGLPELDLDKKLVEMHALKPTETKKGTATRFQ